MDIHILCDLILTMTSENWVSTAKLPVIIRDKFNSGQNNNNLTLLSAFCL